MIKMVNFVRAEGRVVGRWPPDLSSKDVFQSEHWLMPQIEDDALLYSLHDIIGEDLEDETSGVTFGVGQIEVDRSPQRAYTLSKDPTTDASMHRISEIEQRVATAPKDLNGHKQALAGDMQLHGQLDDNLTWEETTLEARISPNKIQDSDTEMGISGNTSTVNGDTDSSYFASYSGHGKSFFDLRRYSNADVDRYPRNDVERHSSNRRLQRFHIRKQRSLQR